MKLIFKTLILFLIINFGYCDFNSDAAELRQNIAELYKLNQSQLMEKIRFDLDYVDNAVDKRLSQTEDLKVYLDLNKKFIAFHKNFRKEFEKMFLKQKEPKAKKALLVRLAAITTTIRYDEEWKEKHFENHIKDTDESLTNLQQKFRQLMLRLNDVLTTNAEKNFFEKQMFWYHFYSRLAGFYMKVYIEADIETNKLNKTQLRKTLSILNREIDRFLYLVSLGSKPKVEALQNI